VGLPVNNIPLRDLINLSGRKAVVTGAAMGIGFGIAARLAEAGAAVMIADIDADLALKSAKELATEGYKVFSAKCDVTCETDVKAVVEFAAHQLGGLDILVNNAGIYPRKPLLEMSREDFDKVIAVNITGAFLCTKYASLKMIAQKKGGSIINIASIEALHPASTGMAAYDSSKGGVLMLTKSNARELGTYGIRVNAIAPGAILTRGMTSQVGADPGQQKQQLQELKKFMSRMVLGRMGEADDIARVALFLASELSGYITGDLIVADGGYLIS
jgi:2-dehydro-3-deoxy-D-gluconate 5-dehydrogenase